MVASFSISRGLDRTTETSRLFRCLVLPSGVYDRGSPERRRAVGQQGPPHISPIGAYDDQSDSFLVLDVNPASAGWVWMPTATLVKGMRTFDTVENRGYILIETQ